MKISCVQEEAILNQRIQRYTIIRERNNQQQTKRSFVVDYRQAETKRQSHLSGELLHLKFHLVKEIFFSLPKTKRNRT